MDELLERAALLPQLDVVLSHFFGRYSAVDVNRIIERRLPNALRESVRILPSSSA